MSHCTNSCESCGKDITDSHLFEVPLRIETRSLIRKRRLFIRNRMSTSTSKETAKLNHTNLPNANEPPTHRNEPDSLLEPPAKKNSSSVANTEVKVKTEPQAKPCDEANLKQNAHEIINSYRMLCSHFLLECVRHSTAGVGEQHRGDGCVGEDAAVDAVLVDESSSNGVELETTRWHESCLKCDCCDVLIGELGNSVYERHGLLFCQRDYLRLFVCPALCSGCGEEVLGHEQVMRAGRTRVFHLNCFSCHRCSNSFCVDDRFFALGPHIYCEQDYPRVIAENADAARGSRMPFFV